MHIHVLALAPITSVASSGGMQLQPFEVTPEASGGTHDQSSSTLPITDLEGEEGQEPKSSLEDLTGVHAQVMEVTSKASVGEEMQALVITPEETAGTQI